MRLRMVFVVALTSVSLCAIGVSAAGASHGTTVPPNGTAGPPSATGIGSKGTAVPAKVTSIPPLETLHVTGVAKNGKKFTGTYGIQRFIVTTLNGRKGVYAIGTLNGKLKGRRVTRSNVLMPARLTGPAGAARAAQATCPVLHLVLGPVNLNLLGLRVTLGGGPMANQPIVLDITAVPGPGNLLGNLLCGLTNALNGPGVLSGLTGQLQQLSATLNSLIALLGAL